MHARHVARHADMDTLEARRQTLERLVFHKVVAAEGRLRGYDTEGESSTLGEEIALSLGSPSCRGMTFMPRLVW